MKPSVREELEQIEKLRSEFEKHPMTAAVRAEEAARTLAKRTKDFATRERLNREAETLIPVHEASVVALEGELAGVEQQKHTILGKLAAARQTLYSERLRIGHEKNEAESSLLSSYNPVIDAAIEFFRDRLETLRKPGLISHRPLGVERNPITDTKKVMFDTNHASVDTVRVYCQQAIAELEQMKLAPELDRERIEALKSAIPRTDIFTEANNVLQEAQPVTDPRQLLPSDDQISWSIGKINERFKKLMGR